MAEEKYFIPSAEISLVNSFVFFFLKKKKGRKVGTGKFAEVFEGSWKSNKVAIKVLKGKIDTGSVRYLQR